MSIPTGNYQTPTNTCAESQIGTHQQINPLASIKFVINHFDLLISCFNLFDGGHISTLYPFEHVRRPPSSFSASLKNNRWMDVRLLLADSCFNISIKVGAWQLKNRSWTLTSHHILILPVHHMVRWRKLRPRVSTTFTNLHPYCFLYYWRVATLLGLRLSHRPLWRPRPGPIFDALGDSFCLGVLTAYASLFTGKKGTCWVAVWGWYYELPTKWHW